MQLSRPFLRTSVRLAAGAALAASALVSAGTAEASTSGDAVVISEVYGGGGGSSAGAAYTRDFVELYNPTDASVDLSTMSVQYKSATGSSFQVTALSGSIAPHATFLVAEGTAGSVGADLPTPDVSGSINMAQSAGVVFLARQTTALSGIPTGSVTGNPAIADLVGYGSSANTFEGAATATLTNATSAARSASGADTDVNAADFTTGAPTPAAGGSSGPACQGTLTIAAIQGTTDTSPCAGSTVTTEGVVTAAYPTGGFNGFYLQTGGTGGDLDLATHTSSDGIFVYSPAAVAAVHVGDHVQVEGKVSEFHDLTEIAPAAVGDVTVLDTPAPAVKPATVPLPATAAQRESLEGMLVSLQGPFTVADNYSLNQYAEISLAAGTEPLWQPTEVADPHDPAAIAAVVADNDARMVTLDDAATTNFFTSGKDVPLPWLTQDHQIRVGAPASFTAPMVLDYRNTLWKLEPTTQLTAADAPPVSFGHTRTAAPGLRGRRRADRVVQRAQLLPDHRARTTSPPAARCSWYDDRAGNHVTVRTCTGPNGEDGPRGAADDTNLARQQAKIVHAINGLGADVVSLEEIENSALFGEDRDAAVGTLVDALNADAGAGTWAYVPTPPTAGDQADEDVIRTAFIYRTRSVEPIGDSVIDDAPAFDNARDPLAQAFEPVGGTSAARFVGDRQPLQVQGLGRRRRHRPGQREPGPDRPGPRAGELRRRR